MSNNVQVLPGQYKHFKGNNYRVFCVASDNDENQYVLYQQEYGNCAFWLRPVEMFLETVNNAGQEVSRFQLVGEAIDSKESIGQLANILEKERILLRHSETTNLFCISFLSIDDEIVTVFPKKQSTGYLTDYWLAERMGYNICKINNKTRILKVDNYPERYRLSIGDNPESIVSDLFNPCSIDLQIAESGFLYTKRKKMDIGSIDHPANATELWKSAKLRQYRNSTERYIQLKPHQTILTHTKEKICIPDDCAGKIEIKSTYARLSLSITMGDFCNPGYRGYFPLEISNHGNHTIILHPGETMVQLMLIPLSGPIVNYYSKKGTFTNDKGFDDGNPYTFYRERSLKLLRKQNGADNIIDAYHSITEMIPSLGVNNINAYKTRFENTFLKYCQKNLRKPKNLNQKQVPDLSKLISGYIKREQFHQRLWGLSLFSIILSFGMPALAWMFQGLWQGKVHISIIIAITIVLLLLGIIGVVLYFKKPEAFCTLGQIDISNLIKSIEKDYKTQKSS